jgi:hypothetical protein
MIERIYDKYQRLVVVDLEARFIAHSSWKGSAAQGDTMLCSISPNELRSPLTWHHNPSPDRIGQIQW